MNVQRITAKRFYRDTIRDALENFELREPTVSHCFRSRHPFLRNRSFGEAFFRAVQKHCQVGRFQHVLEIGGGRGDFARDFIKTWVRAEGRRAKSYTIVDLSGALLRSQRQLVRPRGVTTRFIQADAEHLPLRSNGFRGVAIANEVIADLDAWEIRRGNGAKQPTPEPMRTYLRRYRHALVPRRVVIFPVGLVRLLEELYRVVGKRSQVILTEYFDLKGGGWVNQLGGHVECVLSLNLVCHLAKEIGFAVRVQSLSDFLGLQITAPVLTERFAVFVREILGHELSPTVPYGRKQLSRLLGKEGHGLDDGFVSRAELQEFISSFHVILLTKRRRLSRGDFAEQFVPTKEPGVLKLTSRKGRPFLVTSHPFTFHALNRTGEQIWSRINGKNSLRDITAHLVRSYGIPRQRALRDTLNFVLALYRHHYITSAE